MFLIPRRYPHSTERITSFLKSLETHSEIMKCVSYAVDEINNTQQTLDDNAHSLYHNGVDRYRGMSVFRSTQYADLTLAGVEVKVKMIVHFFGQNPTSISFQYLRAPGWKLIVKNHPIQYTGNLDRLTSDMAVIVLHSD